MSNCRQTAEKIWDVVVLGGGVSGCMAAMAAADEGAKVLIIEEYGFLGGSLTNAGVGPMMTFHAGTRQVVKGLAQELVDRMTALGGCIGHIEDTIGYASSVTPFDTETMKYALDLMTKERGIDILYHAVLTDAAVTDGVISSVTVQTRGGALEIRGRVFIDATGDAALSYLAGATVRQGRDSDGLCQPMTMNLKVSGVDIPRLRAEIKGNRDNFNVQDHDRLDRTPRVSMGGFVKEFDAAKAAGEIDIPRDDILLFETMNPGEVIVNTTRITRLNPVDPWDISQAETEGRRQAHDLIAFLRKRCAGFGNAVLISTGMQVGVRESRRVEGDYVLTGEDLLASKKFNDAIALGGYPIDIHNPDGTHTETTHLKPGQFYYIPLRALIAKGMGNLMVCGRCISVTHEAGAAIRVTPIAMAIGQAAGTAAGLAAVSGKTPREVDPQTVRAELVNHGACIE